MRSLVPVDKGTLEQTVHMPRQGVILLGSPLQVAVSIESLFRFLHGHARLNSRWKSLVRLLHRLGPFLLVHVGIGDVLLKVMNFLNQVVVHRVEHALVALIDGVRQDACDRNKNGDEPVHGRVHQCFYKHLVRCGRKGGIDASIHYHEKVPQCNAAPDEDMLDPCEVAQCHCNLYIDDPNHARIHGGSEFLNPCKLPVVPVGFDLECCRGEEESHDGAIDSVGHPSQNTAPREKHILRTLLI